MKSSVRPESLPVLLTSNMRTHPPSLEGVSFPQDGVGRGEGEPYKMYKL